MQSSTGLKLLLLIAVFALAQTLHTPHSIPGLARISPFENHFRSIQDHGDQNARVDINRNQHYEFFYTNHENPYYIFRNLGTFRYLQCPEQLGQQFEFVNYLGGGIPTVKYLIIQGPIVNNVQSFRIKCAQSDLYMGRELVGGRVNVVAQRLPPTPNPNPTQNQAPDQTLWRFESR